MDRSRFIEEPRLTLSRDHQGIPALAAWHAVLAVLTALVAFFHSGGWIGATANGLAVAGGLALTAPALAGLLLLARDGSAERAGLLGLWTLGAVASAGLSGGLTGPMGGFVFLPLAAGVALGGPRLMQAGALGAGAAALAGLLSVALNGPAQVAPASAAASAVLTALAAATAFRLAWARQARARGAADEAVARIETVLAGQPGLTLVLEPEGAVLAAYGAAPAALPIDALFERGLIEAVHPPDRPAVQAALTKASGGSDAQIRFAPRTALDRRILLALRRTEGPQGPRLIALALDATLQHAREAELDAARLDAETQNLGKTRFLANMSHELRTPLNAVLGFSDAMRQNLFGPLPRRYVEYAASIHEAGGHLLDLINDVLDVSRIEAARYELQRERFDVRETVSAAMALVRLQADSKGIDLTAVLPEDALTVEADRRAVKQMVLNLLSNAIKFTPEGGSAVVTAEVVDQMLELTVADTGVGVSAPDLARLGRPFEQAGNAEQRARGTGLGLSLVRSLAELHGGAMTMESTLGEGTAVTVRLPVVVGARPAIEGGAEIIPLPRAG